jgi:hypothetical protein
MKALFDLVHIDVCGPFTIASLSNVHYVLTFTDDYSKFDWVFFFKKKSDVFLQFKQFRAKIELQFEKPIKALCSGKGGENIFIDFMNSCKDHGIIQQFTQTYIPHRMALQKDEIKPSLSELRVLLSVQTFLLACGQKLLALPII